MTPTTHEAKKIAATALHNAGLSFTKLRAKTHSFGGMGEPCVFITPVGLALPDPRIAEAKAALKNHRVILDTPSVVAPGHIVE